MKVLGAGLDDTTIAFMREHGIAVEKQDIEGVEDLEDWIKDAIYDAAVIDLEKSGLGIYIARGFRAKKITTPIIGISRGSEDRGWGDQRAMFLENGGDDLLRGPPNPRELTASLRVAVRRYQGSMLDFVEYESGGAKLRVNVTRRAAYVNNESIHLTGKETSMLLLFASSPGRVLSKEMIMENLYTAGIDDEPEMKIIDVFVCKLRRKLTDVHPDAEKFIETIWGRGYRLPPQAELSRKAA
jgi:two-component system cell cycle response regulator CtrA